ncbi:MAG: flavodoxin-like protein [Pseudonocardiales bacterium]|nr:flavodoxin-like protein [Pseudonocardiales bacterium]
MTSTLPLKALVLVCTLSPSPAESSSQLLAQQVVDQMTGLGVESEFIRVVDHDVKPGVELDMGAGDAWPAIRAKMIAADILVMAAPTWMGQLSSVGQRVLERLDAELSESDDEGRLQTSGKVAVAVIVGNEDGAHHITGVLFQGLNDVGFTIPSGGAVYWNGEAMHSIDYKDLEKTPEKVASTTRTLAINAVHLAHALKSSPYPAA